VHFRQPDLPVRTSDFDYELPSELIAQTPVEPRDSSRLLALDRATGRTEHRHFTDVPDYLRPGDLMVFNQSRVIPARLLGVRDDNGGRVELLLLRRQAEGLWQALARPGRRLRPGATVTVTPPGREGPHPNPRLEGEEDRKDATLTVEILESRPNGTKIVRLSSEDAIERMGHTPLPPYIRRTLEDPERYQTVYARQPGSAAAPTAGLHFTPELLSRIRAAEVETAFVTLHVGLDTFRPVQEEDPAAHSIHTEHYSLDADAADSLNRARVEGRRIIAVGTTSVRVLEQAVADGRAVFAPVEDDAGIYILPGHRFRCVDAMITNFHLPRSTLLMLVSAFAEHGAGAGVSGREMMLGVYAEAIRRRYRFYSFGDAMLIA
jgi:S-adenosylmethionine:tRNA ribosyltransferase-isomerase